MIAMILQWRGRWRVRLALLVSAVAVAGASRDRPISASPLADPRLVNDHAAVGAEQLPNPTDNSTANASHPEDDQELQALLNWAALQQQSDVTSTSSNDQCTNCFLVIGVKVKALRGFQERQAIRETWANPRITTQHNTRVVFLSCEPNYAALNATDDQIQALRAAVTMEKRVFGDLLADELTHCQDSYYRLVDKTLSFLQWVSRTHHTAAYVMVTDDDAYVRIDKLTAMLRADETPATRYYAGQVWNAQLQRNIQPLRDPEDKNYLPYDKYQMRELPPFALGPHFVLSVDLVHFLAKNRDDLRGVGTLEDVTVGFWLLSLLRVHVVHLDVFNHLRFVPCRNSFVSYAHLSPTAFRTIHANGLAGKSFCRGFSYSTWDKVVQRKALATIASAGADREQRKLALTWDLRWEPTTRRALILVHIVAGDESAEVVYRPVLVPYRRFCGYLLERALSQMPTTQIPSEVCYLHRTQLSLVLANLVTKTPQLAPFFYAPLINLQQHATSATIFVRMTPLAAQTVRTMVECLVALMYPDAHTYVAAEQEYAAHTVPHVSISLASESVLPSAASLTVPIVIATDANLYLQTEEGNKQAIWLSPFEYAAPTHHIYLPQASLSFSRRANNSPADLLSPPVAATADGREFGVFECQRLRIVAAAAAQTLIQLLQDEDPSFTIHELCEEDDATPNRTMPLFPLDESVAQYAQFKFALVFDDRQRRSSQISDRLVTAFLAGCVPVYYGDVTSVHRIFNPRAFIACSDFDSLRACARHIIHLYQHPQEFKAIRQQPPVINTTTLVEIFSWHPDVANRLAKDLNHPTIASRLKEMVDDWY